VLLQDAPNVAESRDSPLRSGDAAEKEKSGDESPLLGFEIFNAYFFIASMAAFTFV
jgi:hypothetical protein